MTPADLDAMQRAAERRRRLLAIERAEEDRLIECIEECDPFDSRTPIVSKQAGMIIGARLRDGVQLGMGEQILAVRTLFARQMNKHADAADCANERLREYVNRSAAQHWRAHKAKFGG